MIADPYTKEANDAFYVRLYTTIETGWLNLIPTPDSELKEPERDPSQDIDDDASYLHP